MYRAKLALKTNPITISCLYVRAINARDLNQELLLYEDEVSAIVGGALRRSS